MEWASISTNFSDIARLYALFAVKQYLISAKKIILRAILSASGGRERLIDAYLFIDTERGLDSIKHAP